MPCAVYHRGETRFPMVVHMRSPHIAPPVPLQPSSILCGQHDVREVVALTLSRCHSHSPPHLPPQGFHFLVTFVAGGRIRDTQCGFKLFTRRAAALLYANQRLQRWCFDVELIYLAEQLGVPLAEVCMR